MTRSVSRRATRWPAVALVVALPVALVALPVVTAPAPTAQPVAPVVHTLPLAASVAAPLGVLRAGAPRGRTLVLTPPRATARYQLVGVTWADDPRAGDIEVSVRTRTGGRWADWHRLDAERDEGPDATSHRMARTPPRAGTAPYFAGRSDGVQVRVDLLRGPAPRDLRVDLVDAGRSAADASLARPAPSAVAAAFPSTPTIISRSQWGADERLRREAPAYSTTVKIAFVHHTDTGNGYTATQVPALLRGIYAYHARSLGWSDIGYNFLVDKYGRVFEGRYGGAGRPVIGAHTGGFNTDSVGVALLGSYGAAVPSSRQLGALERLLAWKLALHYRDPRGTDTLVSGGGTARYAKGTAVRFNVVSGHRDAVATACPGAAVYARLPAIRRGVYAASGAGLVAPAVTVAAGGRGVRVTAGVLRPQRWVGQLLGADGTVLAAARGVATRRIDATLAPRGAIPADLYELRLESWAGRNPARRFDVRLSLQGVDRVGAAADRAGSVLIATRGDQGAVSVRRWRPGRSPGDADDLGGVAAGAPDVLARADGEVEVHVRGTDNAIYRQVRSGRRKWSGWQRIPFSVLATPRAVQLPSDEVALVVVGTDRAVWFQPSAGSGWQRLGGGVLPGSAPGVVATLDGRLSTFVVGTDGQAWRATRTPNGAWGRWTALGGRFTGDLAAARSRTGVVVAGRGRDGGVYTLRIVGAAVGRWTRVGRLTAVGSPALAVDRRSSRVRVFATAADDRTYTAFASDPAAAPRATWTALR